MARSQHSTCPFPSGSRLLVLAVCLLGLSHATGASAQPVIEVLHSFTVSPSNPYTTLVQGPDGRLYGTYRGDNAGGLYRTDITGTVEVLHIFTQDSGVDPSGALTLASDGFLYGTTLRGGSANLGTIYRVDPTTGEVTNIHSFMSTVPSGRYPSGLIQASDGFLYGTTREGGTAGGGAVYRLDPTTGSVMTLYSFSFGLNSFPAARLTQATDGYLYGTTEIGEVGPGSVYRVDPVTGTVTIVHSFASTWGGRPPYAALTQANDGFLYGTARTGIENKGGVLYRLDPVSGVVTTLHTFSTTSQGQNPGSALTQASDGFLYGTTTSGGIADVGAIYRFEPATGSVTTVHSFTGTMSGRTPTAGIVQANDGFLYGTTSGGGVHNRGTIYRLDSATGALATVHSFTTSGSGVSPRARLTVASDGLLYGTTNAGGAADMGTVFRLDPVSGNVTTVHSFTGPNGASPRAWLTQASDGFLYGTTTGGGNANRGTIYRLDPASGGVTSVHSFTATSTTGSGPEAPLTRANDGFLYGTTTNGDGASRGAIYRFDLGSGVASTVHSFSAAVGGQLPMGALTQATDGFLYGTTYYGGQDGVGTVYRWDPVSGAVTTIHSFTVAPTSGRHPYAGLTLANDGFLYGTTVDGAGTVYRLDPVGGVVTTVHSFTATMGGGQTAYAEPVQASDGFLYGTTVAGGTANAGTVYRLDPSSGIVTTLFSLTHDSTGGSPIAGLTMASDGAFYGVTSTGGPGGGGTVFRLWTSATPLAQDGTLLVTEDTPASGTLAAIDNNGEPLTFSIVAGAAHGAVLITDPATGAYSYAPAANFYGNDTFTFKANDGGADSNIATVSITVTPVNDAPIAINGVITTAEDTPAIGMLTAADIDSPTLTFGVVTNGSRGAAVIINPATGAFTYTPNSNEHGSDTFTFSVTDSGGLPSNVATVTVTIEPAADTPNVRFREAPFVATADMLAARRSHAAALLNDGRVLLAGSDNFSRSAELFDPQSGTTVATGSLNIGRCYGCAWVALPDGRVLLVGGWSGGPVQQSAEVYDPATGAFALLPEQLTTPRLGPTTTTLADGRILIHGGHNGFSIHASAELFDPSTGLFTETGGTSLPRLAPAIRLHDGRVLVAGGFSNGGAHLSSTELYDPQTQTFSETGSLNAPRSSHRATMLADGRILITGGANGTSAALASAEIYDPLTGNFTLTGSMTTPRVGHSAGLLVDGSVIVFGGQNAAGQVLDTAEVFDPATGQFVPAASMMTTPRTWHEVTELRDGRLLITGGQNQSGQLLATAEMYGLPAIVYGTPLESAELIASADVPGTFSFHPSAGTLLSAGVHILSATFIPDDTANYVPTTKTSAIRVLRARPALSWSVPADIIEGTALGSTQLNASATVPGTFAYQPATGSLLPVGSHVLSVTFTPADADNYEVSTTSVMISVLPPRSVSLVSPNGGERVFATVPTSIRWTATTATSFDVELSRNGGSSYSAIPGCTGLSSVITSCMWTPSGPGSTTARVRVIARSTAGDTIADASDANFTIATAPPSITVTTPNTAVSWVIGSTQTLRWNHNLGVNTFVRIELSRDDGASWEALAATVANSGPTSGTFPWPVTGPVTPTARVRVSWLDGAATDVSNVGFKIVRPTITITAPNTAVSWSIGSTQNITWTHNMTSGHHVNLDLSRDGGVTWSSIATAVANATATTGTYSWIVSGPTIASARVRASWSEDSATNDISNVNFAIVQPTITLTAPTTGVVWRAGNTQTLRFTHNLGPGREVAFDVSRNGGVSWEPITTVTTTSSAAATYAWIVSGPPTTQARIRARLVADPAVVDDSNVNFTILSRITVTAPNTAVTWGAGSTRQVTWTHNLGVTELVNIDFSPDGGFTWIPVAGGVANTNATTGSYVGRLPAIVTAQAVARVSQSGDPAAFDVSDVVFTLVAPAVTVTTPNANVNWTIGSTRSISWTHNLGTSDAVNLDLSRNGGLTWEPLAIGVFNSGNTSGTFSWVVTGPATTAGRIRVMWTADNAVQDVRNVNFRIP